MKYKEAGFRAVYRAFAAFPLEEPLKGKVQDFPGAAEGNCVLTYGWVNPDSGEVSFRILAAGVKKDGQYTFFSGNKEQMVSVSAREVSSLDIQPLQERGELGTLKARYFPELAQMKQYEASDGVEFTRNLKLLDEWRDPYKADEIAVWFRRKRKNPEKKVVQITGIQDDMNLIGILKEDLRQDFPCHAGDTVRFCMQLYEEGKAMCFCDFPEEPQQQQQQASQGLGDDTQLRQAVEQFYKSHTMENFLKVLQLLRDSTVLIPFVEEKTWRAGSAVSYVPDLVLHGDKYLFPVFSSLEELRFCGSKVRGVQKTFLEAMAMAKAYEDQKIAGIVLNGFTQAFYVQTPIFEVVESLKSRLP